VLPALAKGGMVQMQNEFTNGFTVMKSDMTATNYLLAGIAGQLAQTARNPIASVRAHVVLKDIKQAQNLYEIAKREGCVKQ
jgi:hypothetical protein